MLNAISKQWRILSSLSGGLRAPIKDTSVSTELKLELTYAVNSGVKSKDTEDLRGGRHLSITSVGTTTWIALVGELSPQKLAKLRSAAVSFEISASPHFRGTALLRVVANGRNIDAAVQPFTARGGETKMTMLFEASQDQLSSIQSDCLARVVLFFPIAPVDIEMRSIWGLPALEE